MPADCERPVCAGDATEEETDDDGETEPRQFRLGNDTAGRNGCALLDDDLRNLTAELARDGPRTRRGLPRPAVDPDGQAVQTG
jgi:hypothetical protein